MGWIGSPNNNSNKLIGQAVLIRHFREIAPGGGCGGDGMIDEVAILYLYSSFYIDPSISRPHF